jgi:hypothetical protein
VIRKAEPERLRLKEELFNYLQRLRSAPTLAFARSEPSRVNTPATDLEVGNKQLFPGEPSQGGDASPNKTGSTDLGKPGDKLWLKVGEAARVAGTRRGTISRAVNDRRIEGNGKTGRDRRINAISLVRWIEERSNRPEPDETDERVRQKMREVGSKE